MPFYGNACVPTIVNADWIKWTYFCVNEFEVDVNDSIFSGNEQQKVYFLSNGKAYDWRLIRELITELANITLIYKDKGNSSQSHLEDFPAVISTVI